MNTEIGYNWYRNKKDNSFKLVYVVSVTGEKGRGGTATVLAGNLKNLNPDHRIDSNHPERFENDPTREQIFDYAQKCIDEIIPIDKETGHQNNVWIETIPQHELLTNKEMNDYFVYVRESLFKDLG